MISKELLALCDISTPHIAGYSYEGKVNGTQMVVNAVSNFYNLFNPVPLLESSPSVIYPKELDFDFLRKKELSALSQQELCNYFLSVFPIMDMVQKLKSSPTEFEYLRASYNYRREFKLF